MKAVNIFIILMFIFVTGCHSQTANEVQLADTKASVSVVQLLSNMKVLTAKGIMIGHQDDMAYGIGWKAPNGKSDVFKVCSDYPAVFGWDLGGIEIGSKYNLDSVPFSDMVKYAVEVHAKGGINTFSWHCLNPLTGENTWDVKTPGVVKSILPGGTKNAEFNTWLDKVAVFLTSIKDENGSPIPLIFRPFHEQTGSWFWWGRDHCTREEFSELWQYTFLYLTHTKNVHNLIYAFSAGGSFSNSKELSDRYPGDAYVDIVGFDYYQDADQPNDQFTKLLRKQTNILHEFAKAKNKLAALTEIGNERIPYVEWWTLVFYPAIKDLPVSYALFWRNAANRPNHYYMPYPGQQSEKNFIEFYNLNETLFLKDLEKIQIYK